MSTYEHPWPHNTLHKILKYNHTSPFSNFKKNHEGICRNNWITKLTFQLFSRRRHFLGHFHLIIINFREVRQSLSPKNVTKMRRILYGDHNKYNLLGIFLKVILSNPFWPWSQRFWHILCLVAVTSYFLYNNIFKNLKKSIQEMQRRVEKIVQFVLLRISKL